jgi:hypothetical protein
VSFSSADQRCCQACVGRISSFLLLVIDYSIISSTTVIFQLIRNNKKVPNKGDKSNLAVEGGEEDIR